MGDDATYGIAADRLRSFVERIERLDDEKRELRDSIKDDMKALSDDIKEVMEEAKSAGFDLGALRVIIAERKPARLAAQKEDGGDVVDLVDLYRRALGQLADTPLGEAAVKAVQPSPAMVKAVRKMRADAKKGGYGVSVQYGDEEPVVIAEAPKH